MYSTCLFCTSALGTNDALEHFPVGRRLVFDGATGRLWVVCRKCERWNLSPIETRWEAIEEAERAFRGTRLRVTTDNIGLAQLADETELVRIGKPPRAEFAAWRYGDQFGKRKRKTTRNAAASVSVTAGASALLSAGVFFNTALPAGVGSGALVAGLTMCGGYSLVEVIRFWRQSTLLRVAILDESGKLLRLTAPQAYQAALVPTGHAFDWKLRVQRNVIGPPDPNPHTLGLWDLLHETDYPTMLYGDTARRALAQLLPHVNSDGTNKRGVADAVAVINDAPNLEYLLHKASISSREYQNEFRVDDGESALGNLPAHLSLALEMSLHEDDERRATEGELQELAARWRDADAIARIADGLLVPDSIDHRLAGLHAAREHQPTPGHDHPPRDSAG